jgi:hypothetical protein
MHARLMALLLMGMLATAESAQPVGLFQPHALVDNDLVCASVVEHARNAFRSTERDVLRAMPLTQVGALTRVDSLEPEDVGEIAGSNGRGARRYQLSTSTQPQFVFMVTSYSCGGGCESVSAFITSKADASDRVATDTMLGWAIYSLGDKRYLFGYDENRLTLYRLGDAKPAPVCKVALSAPREEIQARPGVKAVVDVVNAYADSLIRIQADPGNCGSINALGRLRYRLRDSFDMLFYRPWALGHDGGESAALRAWSLQGIAEFDAYATEERAFMAAKNALGSLYASDYRLAPPDALKLAQSALRGAATTGFSFRDVDYDSLTDADPRPDRRYFNSPFPEGSDARLRRAILEGRPMSEIVKLDTRLDIIDGRSSGESILNVAVRYSDALDWLLKRGANPNVANDFDKTPLMYAAQFGDLRSVELLLEHGAYVNATTRMPFDTCYYTFSRHEVGPLHYAARYAAAPVVRRLLAAGAFTFLGASKKPVYPLDVFRWDYPREREPLSQTDRAALEQELIPSNEVVRARLAATLAKRGMQAYRAGKIEPAYQAMRDSQLAAPPSPSALADYALISLRAGHVRDSLVAGTAVISTADTPALRAAGWFNLGLACQQRDHERDPESFVYCRPHPVLQFLKAWNEAPTPAREHKVVEVLDGMRPVCSVGLADGITEQYYVVRAWGEQSAELESQRVIIRHQPGHAPPPDVFEFEQFRGRPEHQFRRTVLDQRYDFADFSLSVLKAVGYIQGEVRIRDQTCRLP